MPSTITKDFQKVCNAFIAGKTAEGGKISFSGYGNGRRCYTDGHNFYSYKMLIAKKLILAGNDGEKEIYVVIDRKYGPSNTTRRHIDALMQSLPDPAIVSEDSVLTWDFKFSVNY